MPSAICAYATPSWPNCTSISGLGSAVAPASMSTVGVGWVGSTTARPGRGTPGTASSRCRALATIAPVEPAETTAVAWPAPDQLAGDGEAGAGPPEPGERALLHPDDVLGGHDPQLRAAAEPGDDRPQPRGRAGQQRGEAMLALRGERAGDDSSGA